ncbi:ERI1 exoribonuclease 3-like [Ruditapes philippinarum]|uniref:ERI1 exoribonuclease 3-like n=1 Tax=Ruditapes philippinarum TaxID=129788 RepID=UPI00295C1F8E|nr:ERI1 exoribonuclease 3-like [Ruditapes philippinarum]
MNFYGLSRQSSFVSFIKTLEHNWLLHVKTTRTLKTQQTRIKSSQNFSTSCKHLTVKKRKRGPSARSNKLFQIEQDRLAMATSKLKDQYFDYFLVLDFEATCKENELIYPQEIIEFPVLKINSKTLETESVFHQYVQPRVHKDLTPFCTKLTGIIQAMVDDQPYIEDVLKSFDKWMADNNLLDENVKSLFVICGDWDLLKMLPSQAEYFKFETPSYFNRWLNVKKAYAEMTSTYPKGMMPMLEGLEIHHQGRHHSGIDDCKNIGNILIELLKRGYMAKATGSR